jgi:hypothetical protein
MASAGATAMTGIKLIQVGFAAHMMCSNTSCGQQSKKACELKRSGPNLQSEETMLVRYQSAASVLGSGQQMRSIAASNTECAGKGPERLEQRKNASVLCSQPESTRQTELPGGGCKAAAHLHEPRDAFGGPEIGLIGAMRGLPSALAFDHLDRVFVRPDDPDHFGSCNTPTKGFLDACR